MTQLDLEVELDNWKQIAQERLVRYIHAEQLLAAQSKEMDRLREALQEKTKGDLAWEQGHDSALEECAKLVDEFAHSAQCTDGKGYYKRCDPCYSNCGHKERVIAAAIRAIDAAKESR